MSFKILFILTKPCLTVVGGLESFTINSFASALLARVMEMKLYRKRYFVNIEIKKVKYFV